MIGITCTHTDLGVSRNIYNPGGETDPLTQVPGVRPQEHLQSQGRDGSTDFVNCNEHLNQKERRMQQLIKNGTNASHQMRDE